MTPAKIYQGIRDLLIVAAVAFIAWRVYSDGQNSIKAQQLTDLQKQVEQQNEKLSNWHSEITNANDQLEASIARINAAPVVVHDWVRASSSCPATGVLPPTSASSAIDSAPRGPVLSGPGESAGDARLRDTAVADFKRFWEGELAGYRAEHAQWPDP